MGKKKRTKGERLLSLVVIATEFQRAMGELRGIISGSEELGAAYDSTRSALNRTVIEILRGHLDGVVVQLDPKQPQAWDDHKAVLEVVHGSEIIRMPVPMLRAANPGLASIIERNLEMNGKGFGYVYEEYETGQTELPRVEGGGQCICGCTLADHRQIKVHMITKFNTGSEDYPRIGQHGWTKIITPCSKCDCPQFILVNT